MKAALFCLDNLLALWIAARWAVGLATRRLDFVVGLAALFPICAIMMMLAIGLAGQLYPAQMTWALAAVAALLLVKSGLGAPLAFFDGLRLPQSTTARIAAAAVMAFASFPLVRVFTAGTGYFIDDFGYHAVAVGSWIQHGDFRQFMPQFMAYLPLNAELLSGWFALPYHHDGMVALAGILWLGLAAIAAGGLARLAGSDVTASLLTSAAVLAAPTVVWQTRTFSACDLAGSASLVAALYFAASSVKNQRIGQAVVAGLLAGLAAGTKATFLPVAVLICLYPLCAPMSRRARISFAAVMCVTTAVLGSVWYLRNWMATGNPLFPAQLGPFAGPLTAGEQAGLKITGLLARVPWTPRLWGHMCYDYLDWPLPLGLLAAAGYVRAIVYGCFSATSDVPQDRAVQRLVLACGATQFVLHLFAPFCLGNGYVDGRIEVYARYIMPWFLFGLVLAAPLFDGRSRLAWGSRALAAAGLVACWPLSGFMRFGGVAVALAGLALLRWLPPRAWRPLALVGVLGVWPALALLQPRMRAATNRTLHDFVRTENRESLGAAILALEALPAQTRLTRFANDGYLNAPFLGRDWQFDLVYTDGDGLPLLPLHRQFRANPSLTFFGQPAPSLPSARQFVQNLRAAGLSEVFVTKFSTATWPPQEALLEESGEAVALFQDGDSALWQLVAPAP